MATSVPSPRSHPAPAPRPGAPRRAALALLGLVALLSTTLGGAASGAPTTDPGDAGAGWLTRQLTDGDHFEAVFGDTAYPDQGLTIDAVLGFAAVGSSGDAAAAATAWLGGSATASGYLGDGVTESYAGATAKLALLAQVAGADPTAFGADSIDLIARLQALELGDGHFADVSAYGDYSNTIGQSLAIIVLVRQGITPSTSAVDFLLSSRCGDGGFALEVAPPPASCTSGVDTTAYAAQALAAAGRTADADAALDVLEGWQRAGGGFATDGTSTPNANSTGLAAQTLAAAGRASATAAQAYLVGLQVGCTGATADRGAIAFDGTGFDPANAPRATAQALLGLGGTSLRALTLDGASAAAATLDCPTTTTSSTSTTTTSTTTTSTTSTTVAPAVPVASTPTFTG